MVSFYLYTSPSLKYYKEIQQLSINWNERQRNHLQARAIKSGTTMKAMDHLAICIEELLWPRFGMSPSFVVSNGYPFKSTVELLTRPSFGVKWYSSLEAVLFRLCFKREPFVREFLLCKLMFMGFLMSIIKWVVLLKLMKSNVTPGYKKMTN